MDLQNQQRIIDAVKQYGDENVVVVLGSANADGAGLYAETLSAGDPTYAGPLAGVSLGLPVYHVFDEVIKVEADPTVWEEQISMMEMVLEPENLIASVADMREQHSKFKL
jgi:glycine reductase